MPFDQFTGLAADCWDYSLLLFSRGAGGSRLRASSPLSSATYSKLKRLLQHSIVSLAVDYMANPSLGLLRTSLAHLLILSTAHSPLPTPGYALSRDAEAKLYVRIEEHLEYIICFILIASTYDHRVWRTWLPFRSLFPN